jgi:hypothetical protein
MAAYSLTKYYFFSSFKQRSKKCNEQLCVNPPVIYRKLFFHTKQYRQTESTGQQCSVLFFSTNVPAERNEYPKLSGLKI